MLLYCSFMFRTSNVTGLVILEIKKYSLFRDGVEDADPSTHQWPGSHAPAGSTKAGSSQYLPASHGLHSESLSNPVACW